MTTVQTDLSHSATTEIASAAHVQSGAGVQCVISNVGNGAGAQQDVLVSPAGNVHSSGAGILVPFGETVPMLATAPLFATGINAGGNSTGRVNVTFLPPGMEVVT